MTHVLHLAEDASQAAALEAAFRELAPHVHVTSCGSPLQLRERFAAARPCHGVVMDDRVAGAALSPLVRHLRAEDATVPLILVTDLEGDAAAARRALAGVDHVVPRDGGAAIVPTLLSEMRAAGDTGASRLRVLVAGAGAVLPPVLAGCQRAELISVALDAGTQAGATADPEWSTADALVLVSSSTGEQVAVALQRFRRLHPTMPVVVVAEERLREGFLQLDAFDCVPPAAGVDRFEDALERASRLRRVLVENTQLRAREARLKSIVEHLPDGIVLTTAEGVVLAANVAALSLLGLRVAAEAVGRPLTAFVSVTEPAGTDGLPALAAGDPPATVQLEARQATGRQLVAHVAPHQRDASTVVLLMVLREQAADPAASTVPAMDTVVESAPGRDQAEADPRTAELEQQLEAAREALAQAGQACERLQRDVADARELLDRERQAWHDANRGTDDERARLSAALDDARAQLADMAARRATLEQWNAELDALRARDQATLAALRAELDLARQSPAAASPPPVDENAADRGDAPERLPELPAAESDAVRWAFEATGIGVAQTTASGEILGCSDAAARLCGHPDATTVREGQRLPDALLASGLPPAGSAGSHRFEVCFQTPDGLLHWVLGSATWHQTPAGSSRLQWLLVDRSEHHRSALRTRFLRHMEGVTHILSSAAAECTSLVRESAATADSQEPGAVPPDSPERRAGESAPPSPAHAALQRVDTLLRQLTRFAQTRARRPVVLPVNAVLASLAAMLSWLAGEDASCDIGQAPEDLRINADPADLEDLLAKMVMAGRDGLPAGGTLTLRAGTAQVDAADGGVPLYRTEADITVTTEGFDCQPIGVPPALAETVVRLGGRIVATHQPGRSARLSVRLVPVLGAATAAAGDKTTRVSAAAE